METKETTKQTKKEIILEIVRFLLVGSLSTIIDYTTYYIFREWVTCPSFFPSGAWNVFSLLLSTALGFTAGLIVSWTLSVKFVFRAVKDKEKASSKYSFLFFAVFGVFGLFITEIGMHVGVLCLPSFALFGFTELLGLPIKEWVMKVVMTVIVLIFNYWARKRFIFKS